MTTGDARNGPPRHLPKTKTHQKKTLVKVAAGISYDFLQSGQIIAAVSHCKEIDEMYPKLRQITPRTSCELITITILFQNFLTKQDQTKTTFVDFIEHRAPNFNADRINQSINFLLCAPKCTSLKYYNLKTDKTT